MAGPVAALTWAELGVALLVIVGSIYGTFRAILRSSKSGYIHRYIIEPREKAKNAHEQVDDVEKKVDNLDNKIEDIADHQELQTDALIAVGESMNNGHDFDVEAFQSRANDRSVDRFLCEDDD
jgi:peptidoglycan hydrolase CwlO-like protein